MVTVLLWALPIVTIPVAFFGGLCPKRAISLFLRAVSWFDIIAFAILLWQNHLTVFIVGQIALLVFVRSTLVFWGSYLMVEKYWEGLDFDPDMEHFGAFLTAVVSGAIAFWGFIIGAAIAYLIPYIIELAKSY